MYKRIIHKIVEEHYDNNNDTVKQVSLGVVEIKPGCIYPESYGPATTSSRCENCFYYNNGFCNKWNVTVDPNYVCDAWTPMA